MLRVYAAQRTRKHIVRCARSILTVFIINVIMKNVRFPIGDDRSRATTNA